MYYTKIIKVLEKKNVIVAGFQLGMCILILRYISQVLLFQYAKQSKVIKFLKTARMARNDLVSVTTSASSRSRRTKLTVNNAHLAVGKAVNKVKILVTMLSDIRRDCCW